MRKKKSDAMLADVDLTDGKRRVSKTINMRQSTWDEVDEQGVRVNRTRNNFVETACQNYVDFLTEAGDYD